MYRKFPLFVFVLSMSLCSVFHASGWGREGHHYVAEIAMKYMKGDVRDSVKKYLDTMSAENAATWMDDIRGTDEGRKMSSWHYINVEKGSEYVPAPDADNVVNHINKAIYNLEHRKNLSTAEIAFNVRVLFHLVGDLQQPLHAGYGADKGGNDEKLTFNGKPTNLHSLWDGGIIRDQNMSVDDCLAQYKNYSASELKEIRKIDVVAWMKQSQVYLPQVYDFQDKTIDARYVEKSKPVVEKQILCGGLRLAAIMDKAFSE